MVFKQYYLSCLSHASYLIGDRSSGRAAVVDPQRDVSEYLADAQAEGLQIDWIFETHVHADFLSGHLELAHATGAQIGYGAAAQVDFEITDLADGQRIVLGEVELEILHTPGHTPESVCILVRAHAGEEAPFAVLTGDTLFIGDVGRPDLLGAAGWSSHELASALYRSLHEKLLTLPDATQVFPAHGAGSACGKNLSSETSSTIGEQRTTNYALAPMSEQEFVRAVTEGQGAAPMYFAFASIRNRQRRPMLDEHQPVPALSLDQLLAFDDTVVVLDTRAPDVYAAGHVAGAINVGLGGRFAEMAGEVIAAESGIVLVGEPGTEIEARNRLARIGFDHVLGYLDCAMRTVPHRHTARSPRMTVPDLVESVRDIQLIDVRAAGELAASGVIPGAMSIPLPELAVRFEQIDSHRPVVVYCASGYRSSIAASFLRSRGFSQVTDVLGGFNAWQDASHPVARTAMA
ncbi:MBL fold metallo-hydrolase [Rhodococcus ruber]|uniref:MBL fold metallo-hydrolase n=1 Tax=Rhodococcus ruber TaxID=1830 RepID=UPI0005952961|nr:MBL fold metallo-hydrolase [Rhodococcus ruber]